MKRFEFLLCLLLPLVTLSAIGSEEDWQIVPGERVGHIKIGMEHAEVLRLLGTPHRQVDLALSEALDAAERRGFQETLCDDWITPHSLQSFEPENEPRRLFMAEFVSVYFVKRKVVQIEVHAARFRAPGGLSSDSTARAWQKHFAGYQETLGRGPVASSGGIPNAKHFLITEDAVREGVSWRYGSFTGLAADPNPEEPVEVVSVHAPGRPGLIDPDGSNRFMWKDYPLRSSAELGK